MVFVFFGLVAVLGTQYVQAERVTLVGLYAACGIGALACAILVANNLRDIPTDQVAGKMTLAVRLGDPRTRALYVFLVLAALVALVGVVLDTTWWALLALAFLVPAGRAVARRTPGVGPGPGPGPAADRRRRAGLRPRLVRGAVGGRGVGSAT